MFRFSAHYFFYFATFAVISPYFQALLRTRGFDESQLGVLQGVFCLAGALGVGPVGRMADRLGRRRDLLAAAIIVSAALLIPLAATSNILLAAILTALFGVAYKSAIPLGDALASLELPNPTTQYGRARAFGSIGFIATLWILSATGTIDIKSSSSILKCFLVTAALSLPVILMLPDSHKHTHKSGKDQQHEPHKLGGIFWIVMVVVFMGQLGMVAHYSFFTVYLQDVFHRAKPGWIWSIGSVAELPVIFLAGWIIAKIGVWRMLILSMCAMSLRLFIYSSTPPFAVIVLSQLLHAGTFGLLHTAVIEFISHTVRKESRATAMTIYMGFGLGAAQFVGSTMGGYLIELSGYKSMYLLHAFFPLVGLILLIVKGGKLKDAMKLN